MKIIDETQIKVGDTVALKSADGLGELFKWEADTDYKVTGIDGDCVNSLNNKPCMLSFSRFIIRDSPRFAMDTIDLKYTQLRDGLRDLAVMHSANEYELHSMADRLDGLLRISHDGHHVACGTVFGRACDCNGPVNDGEAQHESEERDIERQLADNGNISE